MLNVQIVSLALGGTRDYAFRQALRGCPHSKIINNRIQSEETMKTIHPTSPNFMDEEPRLREFQRPW